MEATSNGTRGQWQYEKISCQGNGQRTVGTFRTHTPDHPAEGDTNMIIAANISDMTYREKAAILKAVSVSIVIQYVHDKDNKLWASDLRTNYQIH